MLEQVSVPGADLWTITTGCGPPLVLAHGGPGMWDYMGPVAEMVDDLVTVHRYDQRGSGRSPANPPYHLADFITDLETLREHWRHERWVVGGHSWGAQLALLYAGRYPHRVAGLILIWGSCCLCPRPDTSPGWSVPTPSARRCAASWPACRPGSTHSRSWYT